MLLPLLGDWDFFKLAVSDDDGIIIAGGNAGTEFFAVSGFKILFGRDKDVRGGIEPQKFRRPLFRQVVRHDEHGFLTKPQPLGFHDGGDHFKGLTRADLMRQQRIAAIKNVCNRVFLVFAQRDLRAHAGKADMAAVILARADRIEAFVVLLHQRLPPIRVTPDPLLKGVLDGLLLLLRKRRFLGIENAPLRAVCIINRVIDAHIAQIQRVLQNPIGVSALCAVGHIGVDILFGWGGFAADVPFSGAGRIVHLNRVLSVVRRMKSLLHKLLDVPFVDPRCAEAHFNLRRIQIFRLCLPQRLYVGSVAGCVYGGCFRLPQLLADVAGKVFVRRLPVAASRVEENNTVQLVDQFVLTFAGELCHIVHIHTGFFRDGQRQRF